MNLSDLATDATTQAAVDPAAQVLVSAPFNPALDAILATATVSGAVLSAGQYTIQLNALSSLFRIGAPRDLALNDQLSEANIISVDTISEPGKTILNIDK